MEYQTIKVSYPEPAIAQITMSHPETLNSLTKETLQELFDAVEMLEDQDAVRVVIITGKGKAFVAGADIPDMASMDVDEARRYSYNTERIYDQMRRSDKIYIAAVNGYAFGGGCELAMACDLAVASEKARFGQPEVSLGILPGGGGTQRLVHRIGMQKAKALILTGRTLKAEEAEQMGLILKAVPAEELMETVLELAYEILKNAPIAVKYAKQCMEISLEPVLRQGLEYENALFGACFQTHDQIEGMQAFIEKRKPEYTTMLNGKGQRI